MLSEFLDIVAVVIGDRVRLSQADSIVAELIQYWFDNQTHLDMIYKSIEENLYTSGYWYVLRDHFGAVELCDPVDLRLPTLIRDGSMRTSFDYERSIGGGTYNYIKVARDDDKTDIYNSYILVSPGNTKNWGELMLFDKAGADLNGSRLAVHTNQLLQLKDQETRTLRIDCMENIRVFGGSGIWIKITKAGLGLWSVVSQVTHNFGHGKHAMNLELRLMW